MFQNTIVSSWRSAAVVFSRKPIYRNGNMQRPNAGPMRRDRSDGTGYKLHLDTHRVELGQELIKFAPAHERLAADDGNVNWPIMPDQRQYASDEFVTFVVR